ncbi:MAG: hypothetical protein ACI92S_003029 [Planctomycetaceae bacterium]|jgi:hypothetical protein
MLDFLSFPWGKLPASLIRIRNLEAYAMGDSFVPKQLALDDLMNQRLHSILTVFRS